MIQMCVIHHVKMEVAVLIMSVNAVAITLEVPVKTVSSVYEYCIYLHRRIYAILYL